MPYVLPSPVEGATVGDHAVYTGAGDTTYAMADSPQVADGMIISWYGSAGDWAMVGYDVSGSTRVGYIPLSAKPDNVTLTALQLINSQVVLGADAALTDTIKGTPGTMANLTSGATVTLLGSIGENAYVETTIDGKTARGFIPMSALSVSP